MRVNIPSVVHETIDGEAILLNLKTGNYYSFEGLGAFIWNFIDQEAGWSVLPLLLSNYFDGRPTEDIMNDVSKFVDRLVEEQLLIEDPLDLKLDSVNMDQYQKQLAAIGADSYATPIVNKYSDMQDLLLLDPIHDVDQKGWPEKKS